MIIFNAAPLNEIRMQKMVQINIKLLLYIAGFFTFLKLPTVTVTMAHCLFFIPSSKALCLRYRVTVLSYLLL